MAEKFCEFGGLPESQCAHCRPARPRGLWQQLPPPDLDDVYRKWAADIAAMDQAGRIMAAQRYAQARLELPWGSWYRAAFPPEHDWPELHARAAIHGFGPWIISEFYGTCKCCGQRWEPGEMIRYSEDENGWACTGCGSADPA
jgi:hypothetical protein